MTPAAPYPLGQGDPLPWAPRGKNPLPLGIATSRPRRSTSHPLTCPSRKPASPRFPPPSPGILTHLPHPGT